MKSEAHVDARDPRKSQATTVDPRIMCAPAGDGRVLLLGPDHKHVHMLDPTAAAVLDSTRRNGLAVPEDGESLDTLRALVAAGAVRPGRRLAERLGAATCGDTAHAGVRLVTDDAPRMTSGPGDDYQCDGSFCTAYSNPS